MTNETKQNKKEITRQKNYQLILDAAEALFAKMGYDGASMSLIAKEAGLPKANVHYYFQHKENLYQAVLDRIISQWNLGLENINPEDDPASVLHLYIKDKVSLAIAQPMQSRLFATEIIRGAPCLKDYIREDVRPWFNSKIDIIQSWIDQGKIKEIDPVHLLFSIWSTTQYYADFQTQVLLIMDLQEYGEQDVDKITNTVSQLILGSLGLTVPSDLAVSG